jgi:hypothetical protein
MIAKYFHIHSGQPDLRDDPDELKLLLEEYFTLARNAKQVDVHEKFDPEMQGVTICNIVDSIGHALQATGYAFCSTKDPYVRAEGRRHSHRRAIEALPRDKRQVYCINLFNKDK